MFLRELENQVTSNWSFDFTKEHTKHANIYDITPLIFLFDLRNFVFPKSCRTNIVLKWIAVQSAEENKKLAPYERV